VEVEAQDVLEVCEAVVAAEAHIVSEECQHERVAECLRHDREIDTGHARAKREPPEHQRECGGHRRDHDQREPEVVEPDPEPRQPLPVEEDHEIGKDRIAVHARGPISRMRYMPMA